MVDLIHEFSTSNGESLNENSDYQVWVEIWKDLKFDSKSVEALYYYILLFNLRINKEVMTSELLSNYIDFSEFIYFLLLLKVNEDSIKQKYSSFLIIQNDNLIVWAEALMDATLMHRLLKNQGANNIIISKIESLVSRLIKEQEMLLNAKYMIHNLWINKGITLPNPDDPTQTVIKNDAILVENIEI